MKRRIQIKENSITDKGFLTSQEHQALVNSQPKQNKMRNKKVVIDGITFDSIKESKVYLDLKVKKEQKLIYDFKPQVVFPLLTAATGKIRKYKEKQYVADFVIYSENNHIVSVIDVKPTKRKGGKRNDLSRTGKYKMSIHLFYFKYGIEVEEL